jgi:hypothetical protein
MENEGAKSLIEYDPQGIERLVSNFERIASDTEAERALASGDIHPLTNFLLLLRDPDCIGIKFSSEQIKRIKEAYLLLNSYYPVPENPGASFGVLGHIIATRGYVEQLIPRSETRV